MDRLTREQRSRLMSRIRGKDTDIEMALRVRLHRDGLRFRKHVKGLPGKPDIVFPRARVVVFVDGDFWHGYRFARWREKIPEFWQRKIDENRRRDRRNFASLRRLGWHVMRVWGHEIERDTEAVSQRITQVVHARCRSRPRSAPGARCSKKKECAWRTACWSVRFAWACLHVRRQLQAPRGAESLGIRFLIFE